MNLSEILSGTQWRRPHFDMLSGFCMKNKKPLGVKLPPKRGRVRQERKMPRKGTK